MSATFSINVGQVVESERKANVFDVLSNLPDNTQKLITPRDVRDAFFSAWANAAFKVTTPSNSGIEYIGLDSVNPSDRDIKKKILIGKRSYGNLDILNDTMINSTDTDIFFYNTKSDGVTQSSTKISILAGTSSQFFDKAPYLESVYQTASNTIDLNLMNPGTAGAINIVSQTGRVAINGIVFPTLQQTAASASNGRILRYSGTYPSGSLKWDDTNVTIESIGVPGSTTSIYGNPVLVNGYSLEFVDDSFVPNTIGGVPQGFSFSVDSFSNSVTGTYTNWPLTEVMRKLLYPYKVPNLNLSVPTGYYVEVGKTSSVVLDWSVQHFARNSSEHITNGYITGTTYSLNLLPNPSISLTGLPGSILSGTASGTTYSSTVGLKNYILSVSNENTGTIFSYSTTASVKFVAPIVGAFVSGNSVSFNVTGGSTSDREDGSEIIISGITVSNYKILNDVTASQSYFISATGLGYLYFYYPGNTASVKKIKDPNGLIIHDVNSLQFSAFTYSSTISISQVNNGGPITPIPYILYRTLATCSYTGSGQFEFIF